MPDLLTLAALRALVSYSDPQISPDGTRVAYVRSVADYAKDVRHTALIVIRTDGTGSRVLASHDGISSPRWSPDGTQIAFTEPDKNDAAQIVVLPAAAATPRAGTPPAEAPRVVTHAPNGVEHFAWSPDGKRFAYDTPDNDPNAAAIKRHNDLFEIGDDGMLIDRVAVPSHLWLIAASGGKARRLTHGSWSVYEGVPPFAGGPSDPVWTPDGTAIVFTQAPDAHTAATDRSWIASVEVASGNVLPLSAVRQYEYEPIVAGDSVYYLRPHGPGPISTLDLMRVGLDATNDIDAMPLFDHDITSIHVNAGGTLLVLSTDHLGARLDIVAPGLSPHPLGLGTLVPSEATIARDGTVAFVASAFARPPEVYVVHHGGAPVALTTGNAALATHVAAAWQPITWTAPDGQANEGLLIGPPHPLPGVSYPLVMWLHGGPEFAMNSGWDEGTDDGFPIGAYLAARGAYVFLPNYRGSNDLGTAHEHAIFGDPGAGPFSDLTSGLDAVKKAVPIDADEIAIGGHSYGGYMTTWSIGHDARWKAAVVADGAVDAIAGYNLSGTGNRAWLRDSFGGSPWDPKFAQAFHDGSPITYVDAMKTPTLIVTGLRDEVVPFTESFELYHGLLEHHIPVRLVGIPTAHHTPADPVRREAYDRLVTSYLLEHLGLQP